MSDELKYIISFDANINGNAPITINERLQKSEGVAKSTIDKNESIQQNEEVTKSTTDINDNESVQQNGGDTKSIIDRNDEDLTISKKSDNSIINFHTNTISPNMKDEPMNKYISGKNDDNTMNSLFESDEPDTTTCCQSVTTNLVSYQNSTIGITRQRNMHTICDNNTCSETDNFNDNMEDHENMDTQENENNQNMDTLENDNSSKDNQYYRNDFENNMFETDGKVKSETEVKKRGMPKMMLLNQKKHLDIIEKQKKMMGNKESNNKKNKKIIPNNVMKKSNLEGTRRVIVAGRVKYLPNNTEINNIEINNATEINNTEKNNITEINNDTEISHDMVLNNSLNKNHLPTKYSKQIESDIKKKTIKNVKTFSDLRRVKAIQDIDTDMYGNTTNASIIELRKLRIEQRKKNQHEQKQKDESNKRESRRNEILSSNKMSKFAKAVAIKNLSVNCRNKRSYGDHQAMSCI
jgi:hypothetical protein